MPRRELEIGINHTPSRVLTEPAPPVVIPDLSNRIFTAIKKPAFLSSKSNLSQIVGKEIPSYLRGIITEEKSSVEGRLKYYSRGRRRRRCGNCGRRVNAIHSSCQSNEQLRQNPVQNLNLILVSKINLKYVRII